MTMPYYQTVAAVLAALIFSPVAFAQRPAPSSADVAALHPSARDAAAIVDSFHAALGRGDAAAAAGLLSEDALIFESGGVERSKAEYESHHLAADAAFSKAVPAVVLRRAGKAANGLAWVATEGRMTGTYKDRAVDRLSTETMILRDAGRGWKIVHVHWSSQAAKPNAAATEASAAPSLLANSDPAAGAVVEGPVENLELHFSRPARLREVTITAPDGTLMPMMVTAIGETRHYSLPLTGLSRGRHIVRWKAGRGGQDHEGEFDFEVR
jgi:methionine-rich copper-binding protein CopC